MKIKLRSALAPAWLAGILSSAVCIGTTQAQTTIDFDRNPSFDFRPAPDTDALFAPELLGLTNGWSNLRLQANCPCINAGNNAYVSSDTDLDGRPRIVGGTVDMGAYEVQGPGMGEFIAWLQQFGLPTDGSADDLDPDGDQLNNWQEWRCRTDPTNALSVLRLLPPSFIGNDVTVSWQSATGVNYFLERSSDLGASRSFQPLATNLPGQPGTTTFTDTNAAGPPPRFYRVGVPTP